MIGAEIGMENNTYQILKPIPVLQPFIRRLLVADSAKPIHQTVRPAPTGYNYIGWLFSGSIHATVNGTNMMPSQLNKLHVAGQIQYQEIEVVYSGKLGHILAECTATGFYELTGIPGERAHAEVINLSSLAPDLSTQIDQVLENTTDQSGNTCDRTAHRIKIFQEQLCHLLEGVVSVPEYISRTVNLIESVDGNIQVSDISSQLNISPRQLRRNFKKIVGVSPKYFAKVLQMNKLLFALYSGDYDTLGKLGQEAGFYDQSHFVNAMQQFFAASPHDFIRSSEPLLSVFLGKSRNKP
ncbi:MAG: AraC family transcriptional regulator [Cyanobacteria bacterium J06576_12]